MVHLFVDTKLDASGEQAPRLYMPWGLSSFPSRALNAVHDMYARPSVLPADFGQRHFAVFMQRNCGDKDSGVPNAGVWSLKRLVLCDVLSRIKPVHALGACKCENSVPLKLVPMTDEFNMRNSSILERNATQQLKMTHLAWIATQTGVLTREEAHMSTISEGDDAAFDVPVDIYRNFRFAITVENENRHGCVTEDSSWLLPSRCRGTSPICCALLLTYCLFASLTTILPQVLDGKADERNPLAGNTNLCRQRRHQR